MTKFKIYPCAKPYTWSGFRNRQSGPRHKLVGQAYVDDYATFFHTLGSAVVWAIPIQDLLWTERGKRIVAGMSPHEAVAVGMEYERYDCQRTAALVRRLDQQGQQCSPNSPN